MAVSTDDVRNIALLARLAIDEARMPALVVELNGILGHMDVLQAISIDAALAMDHASLRMPLRPDDTLPVSLSRDRSAFAPAFRDGFFLVPRLATHGVAGTDPAMTDIATSADHLVDSGDDE